MYCEISDESLFYNMTVVYGRHTIQHVSSYATPCVMLSVQCCNCDSVEAFNELQCTDENERDKKFSKKFFDPFWYYMDIIVHFTSDRIVDE